MLSRRRFASRPRRARTSASPRAAPFSTSAFLIAQIAMRMAILRGSSRRRIASLRSSASCSLRDIGPGVGARGLAAQGVLRALPALCGGLLLAPDARRFVVLATARLGEDAGLLDQLIEPSQRLFEALVRAYPDLCQTDPSRRPARRAGFNWRSRAIVWGGREGCQVKCVTSGRRSGGAVRVSAGVSRRRAAPWAASAPSS